MDKLIYDTVIKKYQRTETFFTRFIFKYRFSYVVLFFQLFFGFLKFIYLYKFIFLIFHNNLFSFL